MSQRVEPDLSVFINLTGLHRSIMDKGQIENLYKKLLESWNKQDAKSYASCFAENGSVVGFDGSQMNGRTEIESEIDGIFTHHQTAAYVSKTREVRFLSPDIALLRAVAGMVPPGKTKINPDANAIQSLIAVKDKAHNKWCIALFHNTPAQFHGRPEMAEALTHELQEILTRTINKL